MTDADRLAPLEAELLGLVKEWRELHLGTTRPMDVCDWVCAVSCRHADELLALLDRVKGKG